MSVCVGIGVHRKRSEVAVIGQDGEVLASRNVPGGIETIPGVIGGLPPGTPAAYRGGVRLGMAGRAAGGLRLRPASGAPAAVQGDRLGQAEQRQGRCRDPGPAAARGPAAGGADRPARHPAAAGAAAAPGPAGTAADPAAQPDPCRPGRPRPGPAGRVPGRAGLAALQLPAVSREVIEDDLALTAALQPIIDRPGAEVRQHARSGPRVKVLVQLPGAGPIPRWSCWLRSATSPGSARRASWRPGPG